MEMEMSCHVASQFGLVGFVIVQVARENAKHAARERYDSSHIWEVIMILIGAVLSLWILLLLIESIASIFFLVGIKQGSVKKCKVYFITTIVILVLELGALICAACLVDLSRGSVEWIFIVIFAFTLYVVLHHVLMSVVSWKCMKKFQEMDSEKMELESLQQLQRDYQT